MGSPDAQATTTAIISRAQAALKEKQFSKLEDLLRDCSPEYAAEILWRPIRRGSSLTCMHIASRCMLSEQFHGCENRQVDWWRWILEKASSSSSGAAPRDGGDVCDDGNYFFDARDKSGDTCFDVFFATWLNPPIGAARIFRNFETSVEMILKSPTHVASLRNWIRRELPKQAFSTIYSTTFRLPADVHEQVVARFWRALELLCRAASSSASGCDTNGSEATALMDLSRPFNGVLQTLARLNSCSQVIARLAIALFPEQAQQAEPLPLHIWVSSNADLSACFLNSDDDGILVPLLKAYPDAARTLMRDGHSSRMGGIEGRYPLHVALYQGKPLRQVMHWVRAFPGVLEKIDAQSNLPTFALVALAIKHEARMSARKRQKRQPDVSLYDWLDSYNRQEQQDSFQDCSHLSILYQVIRGFPQALQPPSSATTAPNSGSSSPIETLR